MKNLKYELLIDGKKEIAYVNPEKKENFLEKHTNNFPVEIINDEELDFKIKSNKVIQANEDPSLGKFKGTSLSQPITTVDTESNLEDTSSDYIIDVEDYDFSSLPSSKSNLPYDDGGSANDFENKSSTGDTQEINNTGETLGDDQIRFNELFKKYNKENLSYEEFYNWLAPGWKRKGGPGGREILQPGPGGKVQYGEKLRGDEFNIFGISDKTMSFQGLAKNQFIQKQIDQGSSKTDAETMWYELVFLHDIYLNTAKMHDLKEGMSIGRYNVPRYFKEKASDDLTTEINELEEVSLLEQTNTFLPTVNGELYSYELHDPIIAQDINNSFDKFLTENVTYNFAEFQTTQNEDWKIFQKSDEFKPILKNVLKKVEKKFKKETQLFNQKFEKEFQLIKESVNKQIEKKFPNGKCGTHVPSLSQVKSGNLDPSWASNPVRTDCWNPEDLEKFNDILKQEGKKLEKKLGWDDLINQKTIFQNELLEKNKVYLNFKEKQTTEGEKFIDNAFQVFFAKYKPTLTYWEKEDLTDIARELNQLEEGRLEPTEKRIWLNGKLEQRLAGAALGEDEKELLKEEYWRYFYHLFRQEEVRTDAPDRYYFTQARIVADSRGTRKVPGRKMDKATDGIDNDKDGLIDKEDPDWDGAITFEVKDSQFFRETVADHLIITAKDSLEENQNAIIGSGYTLNHDWLRDWEAGKSISGREAFLNSNNEGLSKPHHASGGGKKIIKSMVNSQYGTRVATYDPDKKIIHANSQLTWNGKNFSFDDGSGPHSMYEIKEWTGDLENIKALLYDEMLDSGFTEKDIEKLIKGETIYIQKRSHHKVKKLKKWEIKELGYNPKDYKLIAVSPETINSIVASRYKQHHSNLYHNVSDYAYDIKNTPEDLADHGFFSGLTSLKLEQYLPIFSGIIDYQKKSTIKKISDKVKEVGKENLSEMEKMVLLAYTVNNLTQGYIQDNATTRYKAGVSTAHSLPFMMEFIIGSPLYSAARKVVATSMFNVIAKRSTSKFLLGSTQAAKITSKTGKFSMNQNYRIQYTTARGGTRYIESGLVNNVATVLALNAQTMGVGAPRIMANYAENLTEDFLFHLSDGYMDVVSAFDEQGKKMGLKPIQETMWSAFKKAYGVQFAEVFTERVVGAQFMRFGTYATKRMFRPGSMLGNLTRDNDFLSRITFSHISRRLKLHRWHNRPSEMAKQFFKVSSYNNIFGEVFEEFFNMPLQNWIMGQGPLWQGIRKYDQFGNDLGWDTDTMGQIMLSSTFMSTTMASTGALITGPRNKYAPTYYVNRRRFLTEKEAMNYLQTLQNQGRLTEKTDIEVVNNFDATTNFRNFLQKNGFNPDQVKNDTYKKVEAARVAAEIELLSNTESQEVRSELESIQQEISNEKNKPPNLKDQKKIDKLLKRKFDLLKDTKKFLLKDPNSIFYKNRKLYKKTVKNVKKIVDQIPGNDDLEIVETLNSIEAETAYLRELGFERKEDGNIYYIKDGKILENQKITDQEGNSISIETLIDEARTAHGFFINNTKTGKQKLILNEDLAITKGGSTVASHELFHFYLKKLLGDNIEVRLALGQSFMKYVNGIDPRSVADSGFRERLKQYLDKDVAEQSEEAMALFLDAISTGALQFNEGTFAKLGDIFRHLGGKAGTNLTFKNGRDVYNFIKEFHENVKRGKLSDKLMQAFNDNIEKKYKISGEIQRLVEQNQSLIEDVKKLENQYKDIDITTIFSKPVLGSLKARNKKEIKEENKEIYNDIKDQHGALLEKNPNITLKEVYNLPENQYLKDQLIKNNLGLAIERAETAARVGRGLNLEEKKIVGFNEFLSGYLSELVQLVNTWDPAANDSFGTYAGGILRLRYGQILDKAKSSQAVSLQLETSEGTVDRQIAAQTERRVEDFEDQPILEQQLNIRRGKVKFAPKLKFVRGQVDFSPTTNNAIDKVIKKIKYKTTGKYYEDVQQDVTSQINEKASTPKQVQPTGVAYDILKAVSNEFGVNPKSVLAKPYNLPKDESSNARSRLAFLASTDNYYYSNRGVVQKVRARNPQEALVLAKDQSGRTDLKVSDLQIENIGGIKGILKSILPPLQYNQFTKKSLKINKATLTALYKDMDIRVPNIKGKVLNVDNMTDADILSAFGINPDFTLMPHNRKYDGLIKGAIKQTSVFTLNQSAREAQGDAVSDISKSRPGSAVIQGGIDVMFSKADAEIAAKWKQGDTYFEINNRDAALRYVNVEVPKIIEVFKDYPGLLTGNELVNGLQAIKNKDLKQILRDGVKVYDEIKVRGKYPKRDFAKFVGNTAAKMDPVKIAEFNRQSEINFDVHWTAIDKALQKDPKLLGPILIYLSNAVSSKTHVHRSGAKFTYYDNTTNEKLYLEHALQNVNAYRTLIDASMSDKTKNRKNFKLALNQLKKNYNLIAVRKADNTKLDNAKYPDENGNLISFKNGMGLNWNIFDNIWTERYFNEFVAKMFGGGTYGINPNNFINPETGKTLAEDFNINESGDIRFSKPINERKSQQNSNDAFENKILFSKTNKKRGMSTFDFDDTLSYTKSGVRVIMPNLDGKPKPKRKVIFLAGGAGSGKGNVIRKLGLEKQGFKIVNSDISLEWLKKNHGLPEDMRELTKEQRSILGKLGHQARGIAKNKMMKYQGNADGVVIDGTGGSIKTMEKLVNEFKDKGYDVSMLFVDTSLDVALERNKKRKERSLLSVIVRRNHEAVQGNKAGFKDMFGDRFMEVNTDNLTMDSTMPPQLVDQMNDFVFSYEKRRIDAAEFAEQGDTILEQGGEFDFSEFDRVIDGKPGPLLDKAKARAKKYGTKDMFVLTARTQKSAQAIHEFLKSQGLNIPIENITGLANSTANAKAEWFLEKFAEGYNDMYFVDDALANVDAVKKVLNQLDVKSNVVQAKVKFSKTASNDFNNMIERTKGVDAKKIFSYAEARKRGAQPNIVRSLKSLYIPPSAEDFKGLMYYFLGKGKQGEQDLKFFKDNLFTPFAEGIRAWNMYKQSMVKDYKALLKSLPININQKVTGTNFTNDTAIRVYLWNKNGFNIPGISKTLQAKLMAHVNNHRDIKRFADNLSNITKRKDGYVKPSENWMVETIATDLNNIVNKVGRKEFLSEWINNKDIIFSKENMNKIRALYGDSFTEALENILYRMENGGNRRVSTDKNTNRLVNWINDSVGAIMFFNMRSAILQTISTVNFMNWGDNNIFKASAAFANQPQFWKDFVTLFNSDQLKQRRAGLQIDVSASELTKSFSEGGYNPQTVINYLLQIGFKPTQIADSFAIAFGGASFFRNRYNTYIKKGMSETAAREQAMLDFQEVAEETQQSSREDLISQQQASPLGRIILAFQNVTMQMGRLTKKGLSDIVNGRGDMKTNISKVIYYGVVQNIVFAALQSALAMIMWGDDEEEIENRKVRAANQALDSFLRGTGLYGAAVSTLKNIIIQWDIQSKKGYGQQDASKIALEAINLSPPIGSKIRKIVNAFKTIQYNEGVSDELGWRVENPKLHAAAAITEALFNIPLERVIRKANNIEEGITGDHLMWQRIALLSGWNHWSIGVKDEELEEAKSEAKRKRKEKKKKKNQTPVPNSEIEVLEEQIQDNKNSVEVVEDAVKTEEVKKEEKEEKEKVEEKEKKPKKIRCSGIRTNGQRCGMTTQSGGKNWKCVHHREFKDGSDTDGDGLKEYRCTATKTNGERCKNKTENKNKKCYAHQ